MAQAAMEEVGVMEAEVDIELLPVCPGLHCLNISFFIQTSVDGHLGFFYVLAVTNSAAMNTALRVSLGIMVFSGCMPSSEIAE